MGLHIPKADIPEGFHLIHKRCSKRTEYTSSVGFTIILSKEKAWNFGTDEIRETVFKKHILKAHIRFDFSTQKGGLYEQQWSELFDDYQFHSNNCTRIKMKPV